MAISIKTLYKNKFKKWVKNHKERGTSYIGFSNDSDSCPIANYIEEELEKQNVSIFYDCIWIETKSYNTPPWVVKFIDKIDNSNEEGRHISPSEALEILERI